ncbi:hypothetical protein [Microlunatus soli]|uniref:DUF4352 domain-containing protein n=1 Tax=Microlunatus soli TaxID=630515 RepID=A0A1H1UIC6_9ACTN|nr:hypothetical protein [Microlunatus soli]SDS72242.1 hypothetical protein SAMN04489812_2803 [Microlunatus soli]
MSGQQAGQPQPASHARRDRVIAILLAVVCIVVTGIAVELSDTLGDLKARRTVRVGESASLNGGTVTVTKVEAGTELSDGGTYEEKIIKTPGMFLAITISYRVPGEEATVGGLGGLALEASGLTYKPFGNSILKVRAGYEGTGTLLYQVDPKQLDDAVLTLDHDEMFYVTPQQVRVDLGIDDSNAAQWYRSAKGRVLRPDDQSERPIR